MFRLFGPQGEVLESTAGLTLEGTVVRFLGEPLTFGLGPGILGRVFNGVGQVIDGGPPVAAHRRVPIEGLPMNPVARALPRDFIDIELSTKGVNQIKSATLALYGRSYSVGTSGSFNWMTFTGAGATPANSVSNAAPYQWYGASVIGAIPAGDGGILMRIKAGPNSNSLVVNRIELCLDAS